VNVRVFNKHHRDAPPGAVYVGRPTKWGNPFSHQNGTLAEFKVATRDEAVDAYERWLVEQPDLVAAAKRELRGKPLVCWCSPAKCHATVLARVANEADLAFSWARRGGYEVSSKGDRRFSAFNAVLGDGRTIEEHYQCDVKGYDPGGRDWKLGKGRPALREVDLWDEYLALWRAWSEQNLPLMRELYRAARRQGGVLSDCFASTPVNQAHALATLLNELATAGMSRR